MPRILSGLQYNFRWLGRAVDHTQCAGLILLLFIYCLLLLPLHGGALCWALVLISVLVLSGWFLPVEFLFYLCFISFLYLDLYALDDAVIS